MAAEEAPDAADAAAGHLRVRRQRGQVWPESGLLAKAFEEDNEIRSIFRHNKGHLLQWPKPSLVGCASLKALSLNVAVLKISLEVWGAAIPAPKSMAIDWLKKEVSEAHGLMNALGTAQTVPVYVDSWGIKRLATLAMRRWKAPIGALRDRSLHVLFDVMTAAWGQDAEAAEVDDDSPVAAADDIQLIQLVKRLLRFWKPRLMMTDWMMRSELRNSSWRSYRDLSFYYTCLLRWTRGLFLSLTIA
ncbi:unnamed protein product [Symbiodinium sp. CCMP2592]|nr:unnamed protein product [Symbiodinium sp. CCMP2592]CAE7814570.1 unnamed protein product [Symbiodinium sp. CCMP2592]